MNGTGIAQRLEQKKNYENRSNSCSNGKYFPNY